MWPGIKCAIRGRAFAHCGIPQLWQLQPVPVTAAVLVPVTVSVPVPVPVTAAV